ncbi:hypothetical protein M8494_16350 [Serratia ureilytica]
MKRAKATSNSRNVTFYYPAKETPALRDIGENAGRQDWRWWAARVRAKSPSPTC